ncbi:RNA polymerase sigma factor region1.1 domain-containing protein [Methylobacterium iners]|uniref:RNA polymerase sigma factor 70 region 1.1 domain-containing protein n=1 Tax=Methylobacterium iners TaxID=418707 RepID=A0ABQ4RUA4_9HYPH|nr:RNA polymerase sigma factor region1.1 domain-containing protein [Methylobacterium iners]GJD93192.1 hypothetical protein OCOJLMKI_0383 [Methylobacterium iners]
MASTIDRGTLDRLIVLGGERGELTAAELQAVLPVDSMDVDALVLVMLELEAAGISVEPEVFGPRAHEPVSFAPELPPVASDAVEPVARAAEGGPMMARPVADIATAPAATVTSRERTDVNRIVLISGLATFLILAILLVLI